MSKENNSQRSAAAFYQKKLEYAFMAFLTALAPIFYKISFVFAEEVSPKVLSEENSNSIKSALPGSVRIGFFFGGKSYPLFQAYSNDYFSKEGVSVDFYSQYMLKDGFHKVPRSYEELWDKKNPDGGKSYFGKVTGVKIIEAIEQGVFDGGTVGESSFVMAAYKGSPIVAVAMLGRSRASHPDMGIVIRKGVSIKGPEDFKGKILIARRAGESDAIFLKEFIESIGLVPGKDVTVIEQVSEDKVEGLLRDKKIDGGLYHIDTLKRVVNKDLGVVYRKMDWLNSELSQALLVFRKDFIKAYPEEVSRIVKGYMKSLKHEIAVSKKGKIYRKKKDDLSFEPSFQGMSLPQGSYPPLVRLDLLNSMKQLLLKYKSIEQDVELDKFIDNTFVNQIYAEIQ